MTKWTKNVSREIETAAGRKLIVTLGAEGVLFREKGRRKSFLCPYPLGFMHAVRLAVARPAKKRVSRSLLSK